MIAAVVFFMAVHAPGVQSIIERREVATMEECIGLAAAALVRAKNFENSGYLFEIGCALKLPELRRADGE